MLLLLPLLVACVEEEPEDTAPPEDTDEEVVSQDCATLEIRVTGEDPPSVGDEWTIWLWCDDALLTGAMRISFDPAEIATVTDNVAEFQSAGEATLQVQVGSRRQTRDVTVSE